MIITNRLCQRKRNDNRGLRRRVLTHRCVFFFVLFYIFYLFSLRMGLDGCQCHWHIITRHHYSATTSTATSNHDGQGARNASCLKPSHINPHSYHHIDVLTQKTGCSRLLSSQHLDFAYQTCLLNLSTFSLTS